MLYLRILPRQFLQLRKRDLAQFRGFERHGIARVMVDADSINAEYFAGKRFPAPAHLPLQVHRLVLMHLEWKTEIARNGSPA